MVSAASARYLCRVNILDELHAIAAALNVAGVAYAVCGGIAVTAHGAPRSTKDIDIAVAPEDLHAALRAVAPLGYDIAAAPMTFGIGTPQERHVQRISKIERGEHLVLDLLIADAAYADILDGRITVELPTGPLTVVSREVLIRMKRMAGRPIDLDDLERLENGDGP
jgi:hypothetical protein